MDSSELLIRRILQLVNEQRLDEAFSFYAIDHIYHGPGGQELKGRARIRNLWELFLSGFPNLSCTVDEVISVGANLVLRWTLHGTHTGQFIGVAATQKKITLPVIQIFRIDDGQLIEAWGQYDRLHPMEQIGSSHWHPTR